MVGVGGRRRSPAVIGGTEPSVDASWNVELGKDQWSPENAPEEGGGKDHRRVAILVATAAGGLGQIRKFVAGDHPRLEGRNERWSGRSEGVVGARGGGGNHWGGGYGGCGRGGPSRGRRREEKELSVARENGSRGRGDEMGNESARGGLGFGIYGRVPVLMRRVHVGGAAGPEAAGLALVQQRGGWALSARRGGDSSGRGGAGTEQRGRG